MQFNTVKTVCCCGLVGVYYAHKLEQSLKQQPLASEEVTAKVTQIARAMGGINESLEVRVVQENQGYDAAEFHLPGLTPILLVGQNINDQVIAHELTHIKANHTAKKCGLVLTGVAIIHNFFSIRHIKLGLAASALLPVLFCALSRKYEVQADEEGMKFVDSSALADEISLLRYYKNAQAAPSQNPDELSTLFGKLRISAKSTGIFDTHPPIEKRIECFENELRSRKI